MNFWASLLAMAVVAYGLLTSWAYFSSDRLIFHPEYGAVTQPKAAIKIPVPGSEPLTAVYLPNPTAQHTIWFFHGNAESLGDVEPWLREMHANGYAVFAVEYPGYGLSPGKPTEDSIYAANEVALVYLQQQLGVPNERIILLGRSLGGGPAVELAAHHAVAGLVLQSTFTTAFRVMTRWPIVPFDKFDNIGKLPLIRCPVLVMHGGDDRVVPFHHGESLFQAVKGPKEKFWIKLAGHNDFLQWAGPEYWVVLHQFTDHLDQVVRPKSVG
ncbi:MAG: alpha/beta hydrolase [Cephaloticoccus sp.]|nr:alpha/beta hydrolase [Cephaloticoccus sp.]MCF7759755.1 alpha/beta hydrolase [Cephaloticoccus sp.]